MPTQPMKTVLHNLSWSKLGQDSVGFTDEELLERFTSWRDESAFEMLLRRHGPMVLGVCRRILRNESDAEDAFQATFLVLVRKAASIRPQGKVGNWLYGVAHRTALKAKAQNAKRQVKETEVASKQEPTSTPDVSNWLCDLLDNELAILPDKYRTAIVLCDLEGRSLKEVASQLDCPLGTVGTRLARGRQLLAKRLARHGLEVTAPLLATAVAQTSTVANVKLPLVMTTLQAVGEVGIGQSASGLVSAKVSALTEGVLQTMFLSKLKNATVLLVLCLTTVGIGACTYSALAGEQSEQAPTVQHHKTKPTPVTRVPREISNAGTLIAVFHTNEARADKQFLGTHVRVRGAVKKINRTRVSAPAYTLELEPIVRSPSSPESILLSFRFPLTARDELAKLEIGQVVVVEGKCLGSGVNEAKQTVVRFDACRIVAPEQQPKKFESRHPSPAFLEAIQVEVGKATRIPVRLGPGGWEKVKEVQLLASEDEGKTWQIAGTLRKEEDSLRFRPPHVGHYLLDVRILEKDGTAKPKEISSLKGTIRLYAVPPRASEQAKSAQYRSPNFHVTAPTQAIAKTIAQRAEKVRTSFAMQWFGRELPSGSNPCPIRVAITLSPRGKGMSSFQFVEGQTHNVTMTLEGKLEDLLDNTLPHEVMHLLLAQHFGEPLPRWADEGMAMLCESYREQQNVDKTLVDVKHQSRLQPLKRMLDRKDYPEDVEAMFAQSYSLTRFLVEKKSRANFLSFVRTGLDTDWNEAVRKHYEFRNVDALEAAWLKSATAKRPDVYWP